MKTYILNLIDLIVLLTSMAWRNIWRQKKRSAIVMSTAVVGILGVVFMMGWINGLFDSMISGTVESGLSHVQIRPAGYSKDRKVGKLFENPLAVRDALQGVALPDSIHSSFRFEREGLLRLGAFSRGVLLMGIDPATEPGVSSFHEWLDEGEYIPENESESEFLIPCLIGRANADKMEVGTGDTVILSIGNNDGESNSIRARIVGIYNAPSISINKFFVLLRRSDLSMLFNGKRDTFTSISYLSEKGSDDVDRIKGFLLENKKLTETGSEILAFYEMQPELGMMIDMSWISVSIIYTVLLTGFALTLLNAILMSVFERSREIGIQRAVGARVSHIILSIILESALLSLLGSGMGLLIGGATVFYFQVTGIHFGSFAEGLELIGTLNTVVYPFLTVSDVVLTAVLSLFVSMIAGLYPAYRAATMQPVKAIYNK